MLNFAVNLSLIFTEVPLIERFALARQHGFEAVEIQFPYELSIETIADQLAQHNLKLVLINVPAGDLMQGGNGLAGVPGQELAFEAAVQQALPYATALQVPTVNILAGRQPLDADLLPCLEVLSRNLVWASDMFAGVGIVPVIEMINGFDMPRFLLQHLAQGQEMLEAVNHPALKLQFDCYHMARMGENIIEGLAENLHNIGHIQFADYPDRHEPLSGRLDFMAIFKWINHSHYQGYTAAEYRPRTRSENSFEWFTLNYH